MACGAPLHAGRPPQRNAAYKQTDAKEIRPESSSLLSMCPPRGTLPRARQKPIIDEQNSLRRLRRHVLLHVSMAAVIHVTAAVILFLGILNLPLI